MAARPGGTPTTTDRSSNPHAHALACPVCGEEVLLRWAQIKGDLIYLRCWSDHRFGLDGQPLPDE